MDSVNSNTIKPLYRTTRVVWYVLGVIESLLLFRVILKFLGANPGAGFTDFIYTVTYPFVAPFLNVFGVTGTRSNYIEWSTLLAMIVFWLIAEAIIRFVLMSKPVSKSKAEYELEKQDN